MPTRPLCRAAAGLPPGYFALVMATGIISSDAERLHFITLSWALFAVGAFAYAALVVLSATRLIHHRPRLMADLHDPDAAFGFFTFVAGSDVLAARLALSRQFGLVLALGLVALVAFAILAPEIARTAHRVPRRERPQVARGNWLIAIVATQSLSIVATALSARWTTAPLLTAALITWICGLLLYGLLIGWVAGRLRAATGDPAVFTPDFWITMGALAISILAATRLLGAAHDLSLLSELRGTIKALTWTAWAIGTSWIPVILACEWRKWRHVPGALRYVPYRWSMVFPLGMYAAATLGMHDQLDLPAFATLGRALFWIAVAAWSLTAAGLLRAVARTWTQAESPRRPPVSVRAGSRRLSRRSRVARAGSAERER